MTLQITTLDNGLHVITDLMETVETVSLGTWVEVGTRHEHQEINGIARDGDIELKNRIAGNGADSVGGTLSIANIECLYRGFEQCCTGWCIPCFISNRQ